MLVKLTFTVWYLVFCRFAFIRDNFLFYTVIFQEFLQRSQRLHLTSIHNAYIVFRVAKVIGLLALVHLWFIFFQVPKKWKKKIRVIFKVQERICIKFKVALMLAHNFHQYLLLQIIKNNNRFLITMLPWKNINQQLWATLIFLLFAFLYV